MSKEKKQMTAEEMQSFIEKVGRSELYEELEDLSKGEYKLVRPNSNPYPRYLKAVRVSLIALGYDEGWVESTFRDALEARYYNN